MELKSIVGELDAEISRLQQARALLAGQDGHARRGRKLAEKHTMSAEARARIGAATKARWAAGKMGKQSQSRSQKSKVAPIKKQTLSAEARARIAAVQRARWAKQKKAAKKAA